MTQTLVFLLIPRSTGTELIGNHEIELVSYLEYNRDSTYYSHGIFTAVGEIVESVNERRAMLLKAGVKVK